MSFNTSSYFIYAYTLASFIGDIDHNQSMRECVFCVSVHTSTLRFRPTLARIQDGVLALAYRQRFPLHRNPHYCYYCCY